MALCGTHVQAVLTLRTVSNAEREKGFLSAHRAINTRSTISCVYNKILILLPNRRNLNFPSHPTSLFFRRARRKEEAGHTYNTPMGNFPLLVTHTHGFASMRGHQRKTQVISDSKKQWEKKNKIELYTRVPCEKPSSFFTEKFKNDVDPVRPADPTMKSRQAGRDERSHQSFQEGYSVFFKSRASGGAQAASPTTHKTALNAMISLVCVCVCFAIRMCHVQKYLTLTHTHLLALGARAFRSSGRSRGAAATLPPHGPP